MTEEKLQDSLTKTMSVAFEGMVEMGGQALEAKRLTYAWRMHHLFESNASRLKSFATTLEIMVIVMTLASTLASVGEPNLPLLSHTFITAHNNSAHI